MRTGDQRLGLPESSFLVTDGHVFLMDIMKTYANFTCQNVRQLFGLL